MIDLDWTLVGLGALGGAVAGVLFFAGLALGMRLALRARRPVPVLVTSAGLRIAALLAAGWLVAQAGAAVLAAFALAFVAVRFLAVALARPPRAEKDAPGWN
ncbi:ATP synthase subunit I [Celeribacter indicus]|uniref:ATP synthase F0F1 subunit n=1 Tax=Celeribacter indicus TaxID=1208324 RepID=A0A0B5DZI1_9RHOB|nr:ATP synthase subunit I [Celeribacter indicus]AJE48444.1 ATP synthase F0F1 subunit [Celeribacter indicus]SDX29194.1 F1/F0 ATPase, subunit 2 [Celeribacter indicus]